MRLIDQILQYPDVVQHPNSKGEAKAWCPWHADREGGTPSLGINIQKNNGNGIVKCFVCGEGGLRKLAEIWGIKQVSKASALASDIETTYDYTDESGVLLYQTVRLKPKSFRQRRPKPGAIDQWIWSLGSVRRVLYRLPQLVSLAPGDKYVFLVEGEKDADRLDTEGLVATTNAMGANKWQGDYTDQLKGHMVVMIPDNDKPGREHVYRISQSLSKAGIEVRILELGDLPEKGDVSDWLDAGHAATDLETLADAADVVAVANSDASQAYDPDILYEGSKWSAVSERLIAALKDEGFFVSTMEGTSYYFDTRNKKLCELGSFDMELMLKTRFNINRSDPVVSNLQAELEYEAATRGRAATIRQFAYFDRDTNISYLDMYDGNVLRITPDSIQIRDNGSDGVLFSRNAMAVPWTYLPDAEEGILASTVVECINFAEDESTSLTSDEQKTLLLCWILAIAFESVQPTKPLALAVGPAGSGKSNMFRRIGLLLFGPGYSVQSMSRDKEENFWTTITNGAFATFDNVDAYIPWCADALATASTGTAITKRKLHSDNHALTFIPRCFISLTARTPTFRREDVASRLIIFYLDRLLTRRSENELLTEINELRNDLMSDYAHMVQAVLKAPMPTSVDSNMRIADFAFIATRIGDGLGVSEQVRVILNKLRQTQIIFATEQDDLFVAIDAWLNEPPMVIPGGSMQSNDGRKIKVSDLYDEIRSMAFAKGLQFRIKGAIQLGKRIKGMREELSMHFDISDGRMPGGAGNFWRFVRRIENGFHQLSMDTEEIENEK